MESVPGSSKNCVAVYNLNPSGPWGENFLVGKLVRKGELVPFKDGYLVSSIIQSGGAMVKISATSDNLYVTDVDLCCLNELFAKDEYYLIHGGKIYHEENDATVEDEGFSMVPWKTKVIEINYNIMQSVLSGALNYRNILAEIAMSNVEREQDYLDKQPRSNVNNYLWNIRSLYQIQQEHEDKPDSYWLKGDGVLAKVIKTQFRKNTPNMDVYQLDDGSDTTELILCGNTTKDYVEKQLTLGQWKIFTNLHVDKLPPPAPNRFVPWCTVDYQLRIQLDRENGNEMFPLIRDAEVVNNMQRDTVRGRKRKRQGNGPDLRNENSKRGREDNGRVELKRKIKLLVPEDDLQQRPSQKLLSNISICFGNGWEHLIYQLGLSQAIIDQYKQKFPYNPSLQLTESLMHCKDLSVKTLMNEIMEVVFTSGTTFDREKFERVLKKCF